MCSSSQIWNNSWQVTETLPDHNTGKCDLKIVAMHTKLHRTNIHVRVSIAAVPSRAGWLGRDTESFDWMERGPEDKVQRDFCLRKAKLMSNSRVFHFCRFAPLSSLCKVSEIPPAVPSTCLSGKWVWKTVSNQESCTEAPSWRTQNPVVCSFILSICKHAGWGVVTSAE